MEAREFDLASDGRDGNRLVLSSNQPAGYLVLDYAVDKSRTKAQVDFWFRALTNKKTSIGEVDFPAGDEDSDGRPICDRLLEAMECASQ